jgi:hypothetical protein
VESEPTYYDPIGMKYGYHEDHSDGYGIVLTRNNVPPPAGYEEYYPQPSTEYKRLEQFILARQSKNEKPPASKKK